MLLDVVREDGHAFLSVNEPGMLAKIGVSTAGVGVLLNALDAGTHLEEEARPALDGVPIHILLRAALDAGSYDAALARIEGCRVGTSSHIFVGAADGRSALCEFAGTTLDVDRSNAPADRAAGAQFRAHTNHYLTTKCGLNKHPVHGCPEGAAINNTRARYQRALQLVAALAPMASAADAVARAKEILGDTEGITGDAEVRFGPENSERPRRARTPRRGGRRGLTRSNAPTRTQWPINLPYTNKSLVGGGSTSAVMGKTGTVTTVVMELAAGRMHVTRGNPRDHEYETETVASA